jgi:MoxR-like ATPase
MNEFENKIDLSPLLEGIARIKQELSKTLKGQEVMVDQLLAAMLAKGHVLIEGVPGLAKTLAAKALAKSIDTAFSRIQFTPDLMPSDILGTAVFNQKNSEFELKKGPVFSNLVLIDEINRAPAKTQAALFEAMEERQITIDGHSLALEEPFMVIATQNPVEHEGTYRLPEAQLDRFLIKILAGYPDEASELEILSLHHRMQLADPLESIKKAAGSREIILYRSLVSQIGAEPEMLEYISAIVRTTRSFNGIFLGASPRAGIALLNMSKAMAAMSGRDFITPDDVKAVAFPVLRHRIILTPEKEMEGISSDKVIEEVIRQTEVPR